ncbi:O-antigen ligase family protein [Cognatiluteimonas profundi]|uniref:O-antigen ligase family protein n=1 Tax=Cognatiluteimonas profundi TaxID=2594501 RepID=UPI00131BC8D7|nr:O-antigen ligase family protein [Lysobacter profundi]
MTVKDISPATGRKLLFAYAAAIAAWMFDFKSSEAGAGLAVQSVFIVAYIVFFALFVLFDRGFRRVRGFLLFFFCAFLFVFVGIVSGLLAGQQFYAMFRNAFTVGLYASIAYATARVVLLCSLPALRRVLGWLCFGFSISTFLIVLLFQGGVNLETVRFQILGGSGLAALSLVSMALVLSLRPVEVTTVFVSSLILFLTVTRTYLVMIVAQLLALYPFGKRLLRKRAVVAVASVCVACAFAFLAFPEGFERWMQRLFVREKFGGIDPTLFTRQVEWHYMWNAFLSSAHNFFIGSGMAAETSYYLARNLGGGLGAEASVGFGHSNHISLLFIGGVLGGAPLLLVQISQLLMALNFIGKGLKHFSDELDLLFLGTWGGLTVIGTFVVGFFAPVFSDRGFSLWYGIGTGLLIGAQALGTKRKARVEINLQRREPFHITRSSEI